MLLNCPECKLQVSDKAISCPHCGYPIQPDKVPRRKSKRRKRLPNGFGQISEIKGKNLRKPFRVLVTVGKDENGRPVCKPLKPNAYFETYNAAYTALLEYNHNPYDVSESITLSELFDRWIQTRLTTSSCNIWRSSWKYCHELYDMPVKEVRVRHIKQCIETGYIIFNGERKGTSPNIKTYIKSIFNLMLDYAVEFEIVDRNYARDFDIKDNAKAKEETRKEHISFTEAELNIIWENLHNFECADMVLIQCYSGWRPQELCLLEPNKIDFEQMTMQGGMKTEAGSNRIIPIHSRIHDLLLSRYEYAKVNGYSYLFNDTKNINVSRYRYLFGKMIKELNLNPDHRAHDGRKTFITLAKKYNVDEYAIKYIAGHSIRDITERIYTERPKGWLKSEIEKIK